MSYRRPHQVCVRLTSFEKAMLEDAAVHLGLTVCDILRQGARKYCADSGLKPEGPEPMYSPISGAGGEERDLSAAFDSVRESQG